MPNEIKCPNCGNPIDVENVIAAETEERIQRKYQDKLNESLGKLDDDRKKLVSEQLLFEEKKKKENEIFAQKLQQERQKLETEIQEQVRKNVAQDFENKIRMLEDNNTETAEKLKEARKKELEFLQREQQLKNKEAEIEINVSKKITGRALTDHRTGTHPRS